MKTNLFKPMLAASGTFDATKFRFPLYASPKIDGIRAVVLNEQLLARSLKPIPNLFISSLLSGLEQLELMDGELTVGSPFSKDVYKQTVSGVMTIVGEPDFKFNVFDQVGKEIYTTRRKNLEDKVKRLPKSLRKYIQIHEQKLINSPDELPAYEKSCVELGYEGVIVRLPEGRYKFGRSTFKEQFLVKFKRFEDGEARIVGFKARRHNGNEAQINELGNKSRSLKKEGMVELETLGALIAVGINGTYKDVQFDVGTGFSDDLANHIWTNRESFLDTIFKYKYDPNGNYEKPRFPVYQGARDLVDM